jgi:protein SMG5
LPTIKVFCDWLLCNRKLIQSISQVSQTIWSKLAVLLNCIPLEKEIANSNICPNPFVQNLIFKSFETIYWNTHPIFEDIQTRSFDALKTEHMILKYDLNNLCKLTQHEETFIRLCCLRRFGYLLASISQSQMMNIFSYDAVKELFVASIKNDVSQEVKQEKVQVDDKDRKFRFMKDLAQLRLQAEISQLETSFKSSLSPYIVPDANSLCYNLKLVQEFSKANKFIIIIPLIGKLNLNSYKKKSLYSISFFILLLSN